ncbi:hypothetical protein C2R22_11400 [Salinigranum rubrum]|uniref:Uncharacterized protein n=1 Tax=Salinigranum rubrum TaxID=755307 RepID=A0A2I8VJS4_9EURY|nr:hypothetical protein [Salinigranum rubrum]AUV82178.1 hypothetical protein C2R22_11400 [Salinigranum rubrum]
MPDISVTDDQRERLDRVRAHLAEDVAYGHVRPRDALEYLLDRFEAESDTDVSVELPASETASSDDDGSDQNADAEFQVRNGGPPTSVEATDDGDADDETADATATPSGDDSEGDARLSSVMSLLDDNDDVWREASGGEEKYEVDLPDGGTERARTKDDVRAVLFKHYR